MNKLLLKSLDFCYGSVCKHCGKKSMDPDKSKRQKYLEARCSHCRKFGYEPIDENDKEES